MSEGFLDLAAMLRPPPTPLPPNVPDVPEAVAPEDAAPRDEPAVQSLVRDALLFRARLGEAFEAAKERLLRDLATGVLARELRLEPADVDAIAHRLLREHRAEAPVALRVAPADRARLRGVDLPVDADPALRAGDAVLIVRDGALESTLGIRLGSVLRAAQEG